MNELIRQQLVRA
jgi:hypothetical protein